MKRALLLLLAAIVAWPAQAQWHRDRDRGHGKAPSHLSREDRQRLRDDVDSARGNYERRDARRQERMAPEEREKLRRDVQDAAQAEAIARKLLADLARPVELAAGEPWCVTGSIGIALFPDHASDAAVLIKGADAAMYVAKQAGKNSLQFSS